MFNNRMLAVAAVLAMAVPALGAATPIVVPPVPEQLVEGHTVFTVIEIVAVTQTNETRFAAAVAVLVREYQAEQRNQRFPGVLWFNDQYLTNPYQDDQNDQRFRYPCGGAVMAVNAGDPDPRVVIAEVGVRGPTTLQADLPTEVNGLGVADVDETVAHGGASGTVGDDTQSYDYPPWVKPYPGTYTYENDYAWIGADAGPSTVNATNPSTDGWRVWSDTVVGTADSSLRDPFRLVPWDYRESYLITDPNDHSWIIDVYDFYTRYQAEGNGGTLPDVTLGEEVWGPNANEGELNRAAYGPHDPTNPTDPHTYTWPVWVVNMLGSPVFLPDYGTSVENCVPFKDLIETTTADANGAACGAAAPNLVTNGEGNDDEITLNAYNGVPPWTDDPCAGYEEPSRNGYCYGGQTDIGTGCPHGTPGNTRKHFKGDVPNEPLRRYNALLYFKLQDLRIAGDVKDHCNFDPTIDPDGDATNGVQGGCNPALSQDTNGCSEEEYPWGPNPPQAAYDWPCGDQHTDGVDSDGDGFDTECGSSRGWEDDCEGNSHPFHPRSATHEEAEPCRPAFSTADPNGQDAYRRNPSNHGGSSYIDPTTRDYNGWYQVYAPCDYAHATRNIDIYFSPAGRPFPPPVRWFDIVDLEGSSAPFQDFHASYPGVDPAPAP